MHSVHTPLVVLLLLLLPLRSAGASSDGAPLPNPASGFPQFTMLQTSIGVSAMHMQLLHNDRVVIFDRTDFGRSNLSLPDGKCRHDPREKVLRTDCTAHSAEYDVAANSFRPLMVLTDPWCSSGTVASDGSLLQAGGFNDGERAARVFRPCDDGRCDWEEDPQGLVVPRWYATSQILPDGQRLVVVGGRRQFSYEFYPKPDPSDPAIFDLQLLRETRDGNDENNLYPFVHLNIDGNLFIFANNRAVLLDYTKHSVIKTYPIMPGGDPRSYPSSGSSVLLPLQPSPTEAEVLICGGAPKGSFDQARRNNFVPALDTCGRIKITDESPTWTIEKMPFPRVMCDMVLLPTSEVLIINGAAAGTAGWEFGREAVYVPVIYDHRAPIGSRFTEQQAKANRPRVYHSSAVLLRDGRVLVGGSNPHIFYNFSGVEYPTDLSLESYSPSYLDSSISTARPRITTSPLPLQLSYGQQFTLQFTAESILGEPVVAMVAPSFSTHSFSMNQRMLVLGVVSQTSTNASTAAVGDGSQEVVVVAPASAFLAPAGYYMLFVVIQGVPSEGIWAHIG